MFVLLKLGVLFTFHVSKLYWKQVSIPFGSNPASTGYIKNAQRFERKNALSWAEWKGKNTISKGADGTKHPA